MKRRSPANMWLNVSEGIEALRSAASLIKVLTRDQRVLQLDVDVEIARAFRELTVAIMPGLRSAAMRRVEGGRCAP